MFGTYEVDGIFDGSADFTAYEHSQGNVVRSHSFLLIVIMLIVTNDIRERVKE